MRLVRVLVGNEPGSPFADFVDATPIFQCADGDSAIVLGSWSNDLSHEMGVWLSVTDGYSAQIAARDVRTLSVLTNLRHVVIEAPERAEDHAEVLRVLLSGEEVNFTNAVATLRHVSSRPAPPRTITVWSYQNSQLTSSEGTLREVERLDTGDAELTYFES